MEYAYNNVTTYKSRGEGCVEKEKIIFWFWLATITFPLWFFIVLTYNTRFENPYMYLVSFYNIYFVYNPGSTLAWFILSMIVTAIMLITRIIQKRKE